MQHLFSMFPAGRAGVALLCLRASVVAMLFLGAELTQPEPPVLAWAIAILGFALCVGLATPICAAICCVAEIGLLFQASAMAMPCVTASALAALALALLGPGAYSVDARLFGRRQVIFRSTDD